MVEPPHKKALWKRWWLWLLITVVVVIIWSVASCSAADCTSTFL